MILHLLRKALKGWSTDDCRDMPDYGRVLEHLGLIENDDPELIRDAIQDEIDGLEAQGDDGEGEEAGDAVE